MKPLLPLLLCSFAFTAVHAQNPPPKMTEAKPGALFQFKDGQYFFKPLNDTTVVFNNPGLAKKPKAGIYRLPQDGMPCIVPDTKDIVAMPNAFKGMVKTPFMAAPPRIPNAVTPKPLPDTQK